MAGTPYTASLRTVVQDLLAAVQALEERDATEADDLTWLDGHTVAKLQDLEEELTSMVEWIDDDRKVEL